jgi:hypothetical protein
MGMVAGRWSTSVLSARLFLRGFERESQIPISSIGHVMMDSDPLILWLWHQRMTFDFASMTPPFARRRTEYICNP